MTTAHMGDVAATTSGDAPPAVPTAADVRPSEQSPNPETGNTGVTSVVAPPAMPSAGGIPSSDHWAAVAEDETPDDDADSAFGSELESATTSLSSSIFRYRMVNGRRYHAELGSAEYWASNDDIQNESLDIIHHLLTVCIDGKLFLAPLDRDNITKALDVGTGTGIWAIDFADEYPDAEVIGTDISPIQPSWVPPNVKFEIDDFNAEWTFGADAFDYVHMRYLYGSVTDWYDIFRQAFRACKPGGWVETYEASAMVYSDDGTVAEDSAMAQWGKFFNEGSKKIGRTFTPLDGDLQEKALEAAGFTHVNVTKQKVPIGGWSSDKKWKEAGNLSQLTLGSDLEGYVLYMANLVSGWTREEVIVYCSQFRREMRSKRAHPYYDQRIVYAQKPF